jgi:5'-nucleotidase (lipoprotein e(P4) family)
MDLSVNNFHAASYRHYLLFLNDMKATNSVREIRHSGNYQIAVSMFIVFFCSCSSTRQTSGNTATGISVNGKLFATVFTQTAAEYRALCFQAYNQARTRVNLVAGKNGATGKKLAIVTDIDETILDNSAYAARQAMLGKEYDLESWIQWTSEANADTIAGACSFLKYARSLGVEVFYITNREERERKGTLDNLRKFGFPDADDSHLFLKENTSSKEGRRNRIRETHEIVLLMGDNLADLSAVFDKKPMDERHLQVSALAAEFGDKYLILPNCTYGDWEAALYQYNYKRTAAQKDSIFKANLRRN